jgi:hypothetical protein
MTRVVAGHRMTRVVVGRRMTRVVVVRMTVVVGGWMARVGACREEEGWRWRLVGVVVGVGD